MRSRGVSLGLSKSQNEKLVTRRNGLYHDYCVFDGFDAFVSTFVVSSQSRHLDS